MTMAKNEARSLLTEAGLFFEDTDEQDLSQTLDMNDVWGWACADAEDVPNEELPELASLFLQYGWCGVLYWVSERRDGMQSEFEDINRFVDFVRHEEQIAKEVPESSQRAYTKRQYTLGGGR